MSGTEPIVDSRDPIEAIYDEALDAFVKGEVPELTESQAAQLAALEAMAEEGPLYGSEYFEGLLADEDTDLDQLDADFFVASGVFASKAVRGEYGDRFTVGRAKLTFLTMQQRIGSEPVNIFAFFE